MPTLNQPPRIDYRFTPSQLDAFQDFLDAEYLWGQLWGNSDEPGKSAEEYAAECEKKLIDMINRCPKKPIEAADKGTAVNEVVDMLIHHRKCEIEGMGVEPPCEAHPLSVQVDYNGFSWQFSTDFLKVYKRFPGAISQYLCGAPLQTSKGLVWLYGYPDEWCGNKIFDLKTTKQYSFGKYERKWQKHVYPYAIVESGDSTEITEFEYTAIKLSEPTEKNPIIYGEIYPEIYSYDHEQSRRCLQGICVQLIEWLEYRRELITDAKIFGGENPEWYIGVPIDINLLLTQKRDNFDEEEAIYEDIR